MKINKSTSFNKLEECLKVFEKLKKSSNVENVYLNGRVDKKMKMENYSITWVEEEEIK